MDKKLWYIYNGILLSHKKEGIWVSPNEVDEPRAYYTEWSKSERGKQISFEKIKIEKETCTPMCTSALFTILEHGSNLDVHRETNG